MGPPIDEEQKKLMDATYYEAVGGGRSDDVGDRRRAGHVGPLNGPPLRRS